MCEQTPASRRRTFARRLGLGLVCASTIMMGAAAVNVDAHASAPATLPPLTDPALITGTLPNGMRYYIRANKLPAKRAMLWLAVSAGSVHEDDDQQGYAHFLEHMAFNGTKNFPGNSLISFIEQAGMTFGADLNAHTNFDETVYKLTIPTDDPEIFRQGMQVIDDWASGGILMDSMQVVGERGVVMGEWRARFQDTASHRIMNETFGRMFGKGSRYIERFPIGKTELLQTANPSPLRRFYQDWYRPDLMAVIAVGDFDPKAVEKDIIERFSKIPKPQSPRQFTRPAVPSSDTTIVHVVRDKVRPSAEMLWRAAEYPADPEAAMKQQLIEQITFPILQRTLTKMSKQERRPFAGASVGRAPGTIYPMPDQYAIRLAAHPDSLKSGLAVVLSEVERIAQHGIPKAELDAQKAALLRQYESQADGEAAIPTNTFVQRYTTHFLQNKGNLWSPTQSLQLAKKILPTITAKDIAAFAKNWKNPAGRTVTIQYPLASGVRPATESEVFAMLNEVSSTKLAATPNTGTTKKGSESILSEPPKPGTITKEERSEAVDVTTWTLSNGARVVFKQTNNNPDGISIHAYSLGGHSLLPDSLFFTSGRLVGMLMTSSGGLGGKDHDQLTKDMSTTGVREFQVEINTFDERIVIGGSPRELEMLFQLMYAQFTNPTIDTIALAEWRRTGMSTLTMNLNDQLAYNLGRHRRLSPPQAVNVPFVSLQQAMAVYRDRFGDASDFTFYIVGAAAPEQVKPLIERYVASLPSTNRTEREKGKDFNIKPLSQRSVNEQRHPQLDAERAQSTLLFNGVVSSKPEEFLKERTRLQAVSTILSGRLRNRLREDMAVTYSVGAPVQFYSTPDERYIVNIQLLTSPEDMPPSINAMWAEIDSLRSNGPTAEELAVAATIQRRALENARQNNSWWIRTLQKYDALGIPYDQLATPPVQLTAEDVKTAVDQYLPKTVYVQNTILPTLEKIAEKKKEKEGKEGKAQGAVVANH